MKTAEMGRERRARRSDGQFVGACRVNVESVPRLPATSVRVVADDPRRVPYLFLWRRESSGEIEVAVRIFCRLGLGNRELIEVTRPEGTSDVLYGSRRIIHNGGTDLFLNCPRCNRPRRYLYAWAVEDGRIKTAEWPCRFCGGLRYQLEGTYIPSEWRLLGRHPRPETWDPIVYSSLDRAAEELLPSHERRSTSTSRPSRSATPLGCRTQRATQSLAAREAYRPVGRKSSSSE